MSSELSLPDRDTFVLAEAKSMQAEAATGAERALALANRALEDALLYQRFERTMSRDQFSRPHPDMTEATPDGERRLRMVRAYHEMSLDSAKMCMDLATKALWFRQLVEDKGGDAADAKDASANDPPEDGPLARARQIVAAGEAAKGPRKGEPLVRANRAKRRDAVVKGAEAVLEGQEA